MIQFKNLQNLKYFKFGKNNTQGFGGLYQKVIVGGIAYAICVNSGKRFTVKETEKVCAHNS